MNNWMIPAAFKTGIEEVAPKVFAYVRAYGELGVSNAGLLVDQDGAGGGRFDDALHDQTLLGAHQEGDKKTGDEAGEYTSPHRPQRRQFFFCT